MRQRCVLLGLLSLSFLLPSGVTALTLPGFSTLGGSYKNLLFHTEDSRGEMITTDLNRLRLEFQGNYTTLSWNVVYDHELLVGGLVQSPDLPLLQTFQTPTYFDLDDTLSRGRDYIWRHRLHRATLRWDHPYGHMIVGRQRIAWGSGRLWNPTDRFNPVNPTVIERPEKTGLDALLLAFKRGPFGALELVGAPGKDKRGVGDKVAVRWRDTVGETDYALLAGYIEEEVVFGGEMAANLFDGSLHLEVLHARPSNERPYTQASVGYDYTLTNALFPAGLYLLVEYFYNGAVRDFRPPLGTGSPLDPFPLPSDGMNSGPVAPPRHGTTLPSLALASSNRIESRTHHQLGLSAGYDLTPLWRLEGLLILDLEKGSRFFTPRLAWSATSSITLTAGVQLFGGVAGSEFGDRNNLYLAQFELFF